MRDPSRSAKCSSDFNCSVAFAEFILSAMGVNEDFDSLLFEIGDCGLYQVKQYVLIGLAIAFSAASAIGFVFTAAIVPHR